MRLGLVGMSGVGKTYWATRLANAGFECICCDDMIAARLQAEFGRPVTFDDMNRWLGFPYDPGFEEREAKFLSYEAQVLQKLVDDLSQDDNPSRNLVIDMSGSAIYAGAGMFMKLRQFISVDL